MCGQTLFFVSENEGTIKSFTPSLDGQDPPEIRTVHLEPLIRDDQPVTQMVNYKDRELLLLIETWLDEYYIETCKLYGCTIYCSEDSLRVLNFAARRYVWSVTDLSRLKAASAMVTPSVVTRISKISPLVSLA